MQSGMSCLFASTSSGTPDNCSDAIILSAIEMELVLRYCLFCQQNKTESSADKNLNLTFAIACDGAPQIIIKRETFEAPGPLR